MEHEYRHQCKSRGTKATEACPRFPSGWRKSRPRFILPAFPDPDIKRQMPLSRFVVHRRSSVRCGEDRYRLFFVFGSFHEEDTVSTICEGSADLPCWSARWAVALMVTILVVRAERRCHPGRQPWAPKSSHGKYLGVGMHLL